MTVSYSLSSLERRRHLLSCLTSKPCAEGLNCGYCMIKLVCRAGSILFSASRISTGCVRALPPCTTERVSARTLVKYPGRADMETVLK